MIKYRDGYDGQLVETVHFQLPENLWPENELNSVEGFLTLDTKGVLTIREGYAWDYASLRFTHYISNKVQGRKSKIPSLVHDALCQLHRQLNLGDAFREYADDHFYTLLLEMGFWKLRAWMWHT
jgi:hypothetical protein